MWPFDWFMKDDPTGPIKGKKGSIADPRKKNQKHVSWATVIAVLVFLYFLAMAYGNSR